MASFVAQARMGGGFILFNVPIGMQEVVLRLIRRRGANFYSGLYCWGRYYQRDVPSIF